MSYFVVNMQAVVCATRVPYQKVNKDTSTKDWDGCIVSTVWDVKLKAVMKKRFYLQPALLNATSFYDCVFYVCCLF